MEFRKKASRHFLTRWQNILGLLLVLFFVFIAVAAPLLSPVNPDNPGPVKVVGRVTDHRPRPPSPEAPLGTLPGQVSVYHTLVWGTRSALLFGLAAALLTAVIGVLIGAISAYFGGFVNGIAMRITDAFLAFPLIAGVVFMNQIVTILLSNAGALFLMGGMGAVPSASSTGTLYLPENPPDWMVFLTHINPVLIAFIMFSWTSYARIMNTSTLGIMQADYIQATRALGASHFRVIFRHLIPNALAPMIILAARDVGGMVLLQATFTFIGLGGDSLWGMLLVRGRNFVIGPGGSLFTFWWLYIPATLALILFAIGWDLLGDYLNDVLDPRTR